VESRAGGTGGGGSSPAAEAKESTGCGRGRQRPDPSADDNRLRFPGGDRVRTCRRGPGPGMWKPAGGLRSSSIEDEQGGSEGRDAGLLPTATEARRGRCRVVMDILEHAAVAGDCAERCMTG